MSNEFTIDDAVNMQVPANNFKCKLSANKYAV